MIVEPVEVTREGNIVTRTARLRWKGGEQDLWTQAPAELADATDDVSGFLCVALWCAMRRHEDLEVRGPVSPQLLARCDEIQAVYSAWDPTMRAVEVQADAGPVRSRPRRDRRRSVALLSRGVDSMYAAAHDRAGRRTHDAVVYVDGLEPLHDDVVRPAEITEAGAVADQLGLPLVVLCSNIRSLMDPLARDWDDALGAGLSFLAHSMAGGARATLVPSTDSYTTLEPAGSHPLLDPLFSTERMAVEHASITCSRLDKIRWLTRERPDLLERLKVCVRENRPDNCGACGKCVHTMMCLHLAGGLQQARQFPDELDLDVIAAMRMPHLRARIDWVEVARELPDHGADAVLRDTVLDVVRRAALDEPRHESPDGAQWVDPMSMRGHHLNETLSLLLEGKPYPPRT